MAWVFTLKGLAYLQQANRIPALGVSGALTVGSVICYSTVLCVHHDELMRCGRGSVKGTVRLYTHAHLSVGCYSLATTLRASARKLRTWKRCNCYTWSSRVPYSVFPLCTVVRGGSLSCGANCIVPRGKVTHQRLGSAHS